MPDILVNRDIINTTIPVWNVNDDSGKRIGAVDATARQNFIHILGDMTSPVGGYYFKTGAPTLTATTQRLVKFVPPSQYASQVFMYARGRVELVLGGAERYVVEFACTQGGATSDQSITLVHGMAGTSGLGPVPPAVNNFVLTSKAGLIELSVTFATNPAGLLYGALLFWCPAPIPAPAASNGFFAEGVPTFGWAAQTGGATQTLSLSTNNGSNCYTFACKSTHSASQTSFV